MDVAWVGVIGGAVGGVIAGAVSLVGQVLGHSHRMDERKADRDEQQVATRRGDFAAALEAAARLRAGVVESALDPVFEHAEGDEVQPRVEVAQPVAAATVADFLGSVQRLHLYGVEVNVENLTTSLFEYMRLWSDPVFRQEPDDLLSALEQAAQHLGSEYRRAESEAK